MRTAIYSRDLVRRSVRPEYLIALVQLFCDSEVLVCFQITLISGGTWAHIGGGSNEKKILGSLSLTMTPSLLPQYFNFYLDL